MSENNGSQTELGETPEAASGTSPADSDHSGGTTSPDGATLGGISDDQLPDDLQPTDDNPLAQPLDPDDEATKSQDELEMDATQEDLGNQPVESSSSDDDAGDADESTDANSGDGAQGGGIAGG